jgi:RNA methyltransferase, TrmH family
MIERITSFQNPRVKLVKKLRDKKSREREHRFVIDYERDLVRALAHGYELDFAFYCPDCADGVLPEALPRDRVYEVTRDLMEKAGYRVNPSPVVAVMHSKSVPGLEQLNLQIDGPVLGLVGLSKPGNIGALLRTADSAGFKTVFLIDTALDLYNPNIIRSSTGACFLGNVYALSTDDALSFLRRSGYTIFAAHPGSQVNMYATVFPARSAIILGTEDQGLTETWLARADQHVEIPMMGEITDSLNVSVSGALLMYEVLRQQLNTG